MKKFNLLLIFALIVSNVFCQEYTHQFGLITGAEVNLTVYTDDPEAEAIILFDIGKTKFIDDGNGGLDILFKRTKRIKILSESAVDRANIQIQYYNDGYGRTEKIKRISAISHNYENGQTTQSILDESQIFDETVNEYWNAKRFAIPDVKVGSIIEYTYEHTTPFMFNLPDWEFQSDIPTLFSSYQTKMIPFYEYAFIAQGVTKFSKQESYKSKGMDRRYANITFQEMVYEFEMHDVPAFTDDEFITSRNDYISKIDFQLAKIYYPAGGTKEIISTWETLANDMMKHDQFGKYIKSVQKSSAKNIIPSLGLEEKSEKEKIEIITNHVKQNYSLNGFYGKYANEKSKVFENEKSGNAGNINLYLAGLLKAAGFKIYPVLTSTRSHGKVHKQYPFTSSFNYVIVQVYINDTNFLLLDATETTLPYYLLPSRCLNDVGFVVKEVPEWVNLSCPFFSNVTETTYITLESDSLNLVVKEFSDGYFGAKNRSIYRQNEQKYADSKIAEHERMYDSLTIEKLDNMNEKFITRYKKKRVQDVFESDIYITPFSTFDYKSNPLTAKKRDYPVDFIYNKERMYTTTIDIPETLKIKEVPMSYQRDDELIFVDYSIKQLGNDLQIQLKYQLKKSTYEPSEYNLLKWNLDELYKHLNQKIVLAKKI